MVFEHVHISRGITKLGTNIPSVSLPAGITCRSDAPCFKKCYARRGRFAFTHNKSLLETNLDIWQNDPQQFERDVIIASFHSKFFRWHSAGDIPDVGYLDMMVRVATRLPDTSFLCFTKKYELVNSYIESNGELPQNLHMVFSVWGEWKPQNPYKLPMAYIRFKKSDHGIPVNAKRCPKYCGECVMSGCSCWDLKRGEDQFGRVDCVVFDEH